MRKDLGQVCHVCGSTRIIKGGILNGKQQFECRAKGCNKHWSVSGADLMKDFLDRMREGDESLSIWPEGDLQNTVESIRRLRTYHRFGAPRRRPQTMKFVSNIIKCPHSYKCGTHLEVMISVSEHRERV